MAAFRVTVTLVLFFKELECWTEPLFSSLFSILKLLLFLRAFFFLSFSCFLYCLICSHGFYYRPRVLTVLKSESPLVYPTLSPPVCESLYISQLGGLKGSSGSRLHPHSCPFSSTTVSVTAENHGLFSVWFMSVILVLTVRTRLCLILQWFILWLNWVLIEWPSMDILLSWIVCLIALRSAWHRINCQGSLVDWFFVLFCFVIKEPFKHTE